MLSPKSKFMVVVLSILLSVNLANSAFAGSHAEAMSTWTERVGEKISARMTYPRSAHGRAGHNVAELIVARDGTVIEAIILQASDQAAFNIATKKSLRHISRLPSLPESFTGEQVRVRVYMLYADSMAGVSRLAGRLEPSRKLMASQESSRKDLPLVLIMAGS